MLKSKDYSERSEKCLYIRMLCPVFSKKEFEKDVIEELTCLFVTLEKTIHIHKIELHSAIKFRYRDDLVKKMKLITEIIQKSRHD